MNFFEAMKALSERKPVRIVSEPSIVFRVVDEFRTIDGKRIDSWCIKFFSSARQELPTSFPKESMAMFGPAAFSAQYEIAPDYEP
jgi:hypothetical protein